MSWLTKRQKKKLLQAVVALIIAGLGYLASRYQPPAEVLNTPAPGYYSVLEVADGDTVVIDMNGTEERVRFIGVDTPETQDPRKPVQCFGKAASEFTNQLIGTNPIRLELDPLSSNRDRYNRLLRYVYLPDGRLVQAEIIRGGYGFAYTSFPFTKAEEFRNYEREARDQNHGLWDSCEPTANEYGGYTSNTEQ